MTRWKKSLAATTAGLGFAATLAAGMLLCPPVAAQPAGADAAIDTHYQDKGGANSPLGEKIGAVYQFGPDGAAQDYRGGKIIYSSNTGAKVMYGAILDKYLSLGGASADIGYPVNDESDAPVAGTARFSEFSAPDGATIHWNPQNGAWLVRGPIRSAWSQLHATDGVLGNPASDTSVVDGVYSQTFHGQNGTPIEMRWSKDGGFVTVPPEIAGQLSGVDTSVPGAAPGSMLSTAPVPSAEANAGAVDTDSDSGSNAKWWALPIGLVIAAIAGALAAMIGRNRSAGDRGARARTAPAGTGVRTGTGRPNATGQAGPGQNVTGQPVAGQHRTGQNMTGQNLSGQADTGQNIAGAHPSTPSERRR